LGLFDVHAHLTSPKLVPREQEVLANAAKVGVTSILVNGLNPSDNQAVRELAARTPMVKACFGFYPVDTVLPQLDAMAAEGKIKKYPRDVRACTTEEGIAWVRANAAEAFAIGEIGLDGYWVPEALWERQEQAFRKLVALALEADKPIIIHTRKRERRALELLDESIRLEGQRGPDVELTPTVLGNRGLALQALGRFEQARAAFSEECRLAINHSDEFTEMHCLVGEASVAMMLGESGEAQQLDDAQYYLDRFARLLEQAGAPADSPPARAYLLVQSRVNLGRGKLAEARSGFEHVIIERPHDSMNLDGYLGMSMTALAANDAARAVEFARRAMPIAIARKRDLPYSHYVGSTSLWLGRALLRAGDRVEGRKALEAAVNHLSNRIDPDHPLLLQARAELREAQLLTAQMARGEQDHQHAER